MKNENSFDEAMIILRALIIKGSLLYNSELNISLAIIYFQLGNVVLEKLEMEPDFLGGT